MLSDGLGDLYGRVGQPHRLRNTALEMSFWTGQPSSSSMTKLHFCKLVSLLAKGTLSPSFAVSWDVFIFHPCLQHINPALRNPGPSKRHYRCLRQFSNPISRWEGETMQLWDVFIPWARNLYNCSLFVVEDASLFFQPNSKHLLGFPG